MSTCATCGGPGPLVGDRLTPGLRTCGIPNRRRSEYPNQKAYYKALHEVHKACRSRRDALDRQRYDAPAGVAA